MVKTVYLKQESYVTPVIVNNEGNAIQRLFFVNYERTGHEMRVIIFRELWVNKRRKGVDESEIIIRVHKGKVPTKDMARKKFLEHVKSTYPEIERVM